MVKIIYIAEEAGQSFVAAGKTWRPGRYVVEDEAVVQELARWVPAEYLEVRGEDDEPDVQVSEEELKEEPETQPVGPLTLQHLQHPETQGKAGKKICPVCGEGYKNLPVHRRAKRHYPPETVSEE